MTLLSQSPRKPLKKKRMRRRSRKANPVAVLDKFSRSTVVDERDRNVCQRCGARAGEFRDGILIQIQWSHIIGRRFHIVRWLPDNSMAKCQRCHTWFTNNHTQGCYWFQQKFPERWERINALYNSGARYTEKEIREMARESEAQGRLVLRHWGTALLEAQ